MAWTDANIYDAWQTRGVLQHQVWAELVKRAQFEIAGATANVAWANKILTNTASRQAAWDCAFIYALVDPATAAASGVPTDVQVQAIVGTYLSAIMAATP